MTWKEWLLLAEFVALVGGLQFLKSRPGARRVFQFLPVPFWCYFIPTVLGLVRFFPTVSPLYGLLSGIGLPVCLCLLLFNADPGVIRRAGSPALGAMALGSAGIVCGAVAAAVLFAGSLPPESWKGLGALSASWTGGSVNMLAVKEALGTPEEVFAPLLVVDTLGAYGWMAFLIFMAPRQARFDRLWGSRETALFTAPPSGARSSWPWGLVPPAAVATAWGSWVAGKTWGPSLSHSVSRLVPGLGAGFSPGTWTILFVTTAALALSASGRVSARPERTERWGQNMLYVLLASLGARADLRSVAEGPVFLAAGGVMLATHAVFLAAGAKLFRWPLGLSATASQACVGGTVSAPLVGAVYRADLSTVGLLLAVAGNVAGTYVGLATAHLCAWAGGTR
jgi:uncharacterized membrane protein